MSSSTRTAAALLLALPFAACAPTTAPTEVVSPQVDAIDPAPPARERRPHLRGRAAPGAFLRVYASADCSSVPVGEGVADPTGGFDLAAGAVPNATTSFYLRSNAGTPLASECTPGPSYTHDEVAPPPPVLTRLLPASPAPELEPTLSGVSEPGTVIRIHDDGGCLGAPVASTLAGHAGEFAVSVPVSASCTTMLAATATDGAGNVSRCSAVVEYVQDATPPAVPEVTAAEPPSGPSTGSPRLDGTAEPGAGVLLFAGSDCSGRVLGAGVARADGRFGIPVDGPVGRTTTFWAASTDAAGNRSGCSRSSATYLVTSMLVEFPAAGCLPTGSTVGGVPFEVARASAAAVSAGRSELSCPRDWMRLGPAGLVVEPPTWNEALHAARLDDPAWTLMGSRCDVTPDVRQAPDGALAMDLLDNVAAAGARCQSAQVAAGDAFAASAWAAAEAATSAVTVQVGCGDSPAASCLCLRSDGGPCTATRGGSGCAASAVVGLEPVRLVAGVRCEAPTPVASICLQPGVPGASTGRAVFWGAQLEAGADSATSYVPTSTARAARSPEVVTVASPPADLLAAGSVKVAPGADLDHLGGVFAISTATSGARLDFLGGIPRLMWSGQLLAHGARPAPGRWSGTTVGWKVGADAACLYWDGVEQCAAVTGAPPAGPLVWIGSDPGGEVPALGGAVSSLRFGDPPAVRRNPTALLALGDSLSTATTFCPRSWPATVVERLGPPWLLTNAAVNASRTPHVALYWARDHARNGHGVVTVLAGSNDINQATTADEIFSNLRTIYDDVLASGRRLVPLTIPPSSRFSGSLPKWQAVNAQIRAYAAAKGIPLADVAPRLDSGRDSLAQPYDAGDGLHLSQAGCDLVARSVLEALAATAPAMP